MTTTYDITTDVGKVRLLIGDTDIADAQFTDEEIQIFLDLNDDSLYLASANALEAWASNISGSIDTEKIGDYSYSKKSVDNKMKLAAQYRTIESETPIQDWASMDLTAGSAITEEED